MKIHSHKISITDSEKEIIGDALCEAIRNEVMLYVRVSDLEGIKNQLEEELDLLHHLTNIGYKIWVNGGQGTIGHYDSDIYVWFDKVYGDALAVYEASKVK